MESGVFFQYPGFLGEKSLFLGEKVHSERDLSYGKSTEQRRVQKSREQYSTVEQTRAEKKRVDITAEQNKIEN
ncbi:MAG: hypothetical protein OGM11_01105 [Clostridiaceae bacterium]|nr:MULTISPECIES: hypothetical protein [unclassified Butyricicoccus]RGM80222.1 hypothetical protein DXB94_02240 [Butyricicoccus sp. OM06-6AC]RHQ84841.1 hypothetical protein DWX95_00795 [Butyricicoccus sp. AF22-28AC]UYJ29160.1 MAG: hypothetical protein OGM11_01105 [Clostridiaceae bacterium]